MRAALWDMDGTMLDTERYWFDSEIELMREGGLTWTMADALGQVGSSIPATAAKLASRGLPGSTEDIAAELVARVGARMREQLPWQPGVLDLLAELKGHGVKLALVTMSARPLAEAALASVQGIFEAVVTGDDVERPKPNPEPYERAMRALDVAPENCIAFEDSVPGMRAAWRSGAVTVAVRRYSDLSGVESDHTIDTFAGLSFGDLEEIQLAGGQRRLAQARMSSTGL